MLAEAVDMKEAVKEEMERRYPNCRIQLAEVRKNNGLLLHGISIYAPGSIMAPTVYIDEIGADVISVDEDVVFERFS